MRNFCLSGLVFAVLAAPVWSHEFWIEPEQYQVESNKTMTAHLKNGENFKGISLAWFENRFTRFDVIKGNTQTPVEGRMGDTPALQTNSGAAGLMVIVHETTPSTVTYKEWDKFLRFVDHKDFRNAVEIHEDNGWSKERFRESYTRHAKSLVSVGDGSGADRALGLKTEFVALVNPYSPTFDGAMDVRLLHNGMPRIDAQVEVFAKSPEGAVEVSLHRTDDAGEARVPVDPGYAYLFDAVVLQPLAPSAADDNAPVWETLWASLTFEVPLSAP